MTLHDISLGGPVFVRLAGFKRGFESRRPGAIGLGLGGFPHLGNRVNTAAFGPLSRFLLGQITYVTERYRG